MDNDVFDSELCWCIKQIKGMLQSKSINQKKAKELSKALSVLTSKNSQFVKKRQVMRTTLGDYRQKMIEEENKCNQSNFSGKISHLSNNKSVFYKVRSENLTSDKTETFTFNFPNSESDLEPESKIINIKTTSTINEQVSMTNPEKPTKNTPAGGTNAKKVECKSNSDGDCKTFAFNFADPGTTDENSVRNKTGKVENQIKSVTKDKAQSIGKYFKVKKSSEPVSHCFNFSTDESSKLS